MAYEIILTKNWALGLSHCSLRWGCHFLIDRWQAIAPLSLRISILRYFAEEKPATFKDNMAKLETGSWMKMYRWNLVCRFYNYTRTYIRFCCFLLKGMIFSNHRDVKGRKDIPKWVKSWNMFATYRFSPNWMHHENQWGCFIFIDKISVSCVKSFSLGVNHQVVIGCVRELVPLDIGRNFMARQPTRRWK